jgi:hypothetical protein
VRSHAVQQSPAGWAGQNLQREGVRQRLEDGGYRFRISPTEAAATNPITGVPFVEADLTFGFEPGDVRRYGAAETYSGAVDDLPFLEAAIAALGPEGGTFTGTARKYRCDGSLTITTLVAPAFGTCNNGSADRGFVLYSETDAPILIFNVTGNRFVHWSNFSVVGISTRDGSNPGAVLSAQHGIVVDNMGVRFTNWNVRACGGDGVVLERCYGGGGSNAYISLCDGDGIRWAGNVGANKWSSVNVAACGGQGFNVDSADGSDFFDTCASEQNGGAGWYFGNAVEGFRGIHCYSELNGDGPIQWAVGSDDNVLGFNSWSDSTGEPHPRNLGGSKNRHYGRKYLTASIAPGLVVQRKYAEMFVVASGSPNVIPYDDSVPQSNEGLSLAALGLGILPKALGNDIYVTVRISACEGPAGVLTAALYHGVAADAVTWDPKTVAANAPTSFVLTWKTTATNASEDPEASGVFSVPATHGFSVNVGSSVAGTVTVGGTGGNRRGGGIAFATIEILEVIPHA